MPTPPGQDYCYTITTTDILLVRVTVSGKAKPFLNDPIGGGRYKLTVGSGDVKCPGPIVITDNGTVVHTETIAPCP